MTTSNDDWAEDVEEVAPDTKYITEATRREVMQRDNYRCRRCGEMGEGKIQLHHVIFRSQLGGHEADNLVALCSICHMLLHAGKVKVKRVLGKWFFGGSAHWRSHLR
jgi:5-methylcytosine-specific restriction endonuclease McrA